MEKHPTTKTVIAVWNNNPSLYLDDELFVWIYKTKCVGQSFTVQPYGNQGEKMSFETFSEAVEHTKRLAEEFVKNINEQSEINWLNEPSIQQ